MQTYIALLRGINVSGQKKIKMADLRAGLETLSFSDITTYIQSGNIVFKSDILSVAKLEKQIHEQGDSTNLRYTCNDTVTEC